MGLNVIKVAERGDVEITIVFDLMTHVGVLFSRMNCEETLIMVNVLTVVRLPKLCGSLCIVFYIVRVT